MSIKNVVRSGSKFLIYDDGGIKTASVDCVFSDELAGYSTREINIRSGRAIKSYNEFGILIAKTIERPAQKGASAPVATSSGPGRSADRWSSVILPGLATLIVLLALAAVAIEVYRS